MTTVAVLGAAGRMGSTAAAAVMRAEDLELVAAIDPNAAGTRLREVVPVDSDLVIAESLANLDVLPEVAVDFTVASAAAENLFFLAEHGVHGVCGTTGIGKDELRRLAEAFAPADRPNCVIAPNFAITAALLLRFAALAAPHLDGVEIIELHHNEKRDAPSGTALETARVIAEARQQKSGISFASDATTDLVLDGARGGRGPGDIPIHSVRLPGLVAHEEVIFGAPGQSLTLRQDSFDRVSFMPGMLLALRRVARLRGLVIGLDQLLDL